LRNAWGRNLPVAALIFLLFQSSLDPDVVSAAEFRRLILGHWEVKNCLHLQKDKEYGEDKHVCGSDWGVVWTVLTNMAVSRVRLLRREERTLREVQEQCAAKPLAAKSPGLRRETC
jgi:hypothetical protein